MRICFLCEGYPPAAHGGIGTFTQNVARALVSAGHQIWIVARHSRTLPGKAYEEAKGFASGAFSGLDTSWARHVSATSCFAPFSVGVAATKLI